MYIRKEKYMKTLKKKSTKRILISLLIFTVALMSGLSFAYADGPGEPPGGFGGGSGGPGGEPPGGFGGGSGGPGGEPPGGFGGGPEGSSQADISYTGVTEFSSDTEESGQTYSSSDSNQQAILVTGGTSSITGAAVTKTGDSDGDESDFYGTNAAVLATSGSLEITDSEITTDGVHANAIFSIGDGIINISDSTITTTSNTSGGIMVTGGGTLTANNLTVETYGNSSAPIRSDRGGGTMTVTGGTYTSHGTGSPVVYSTADITVKDATMTSTASEGVVVEGKNSVALDSVMMTADNNTHNGKSETYKAIFLYQSMSGDADEGTANFTSKDSVIDVLNGDTIFVTNTTASIYLENNEINNNSGDFLRIQSGAWGNESSNGGNVTAVLSNQRVEGDIIVDSISSLDISLENGSKYFGAIDTDDQGGSVNLTMSADSVLVLTSDTYLDSLTNEDTSNSNIYLNGHKLYVNGTETSANEGEYVEEAEDEPAAEEPSEEVSAETEQQSESPAPYVIGGIVLAAAAIGGVAFKKKSSKK